MMSQEQLKVDYWSVIVKLSYSVANYVITAQQSSWSQITDCCFFFVNCHPPWVTSGTLYWSSGQGPRPPTLCPCRGGGRSPRPSLYSRTRLPVVRAPFKWDFKIRALSCWFIKTTLLPPANKGSLSFLSLQNICCKLLHHSPSLLLIAVIQGRHKMKLPSPCGARIWKPFSCFLWLMFILIFIVITLNVEMK